jgi:hypothetical protein
MPPSGSSGPCAEGESQCPFGNTTSAYSRCRAFEARLGRCVGNVEGAVAQELDAARVFERVALKPRAQIALRGFQERAIERVSGERKEGDEPQARREQLPRLQRARAPPSLVEERVAHRLEGQSPLRGIAKR